jgi:hypothetical protein
VSLLTLSLSRFPSLPPTSTSSATPPLTIPLPAVTVLLSQKQGDDGGDDVMCAVCVVHFCGGVDVVCARREALAADAAE